MKKFKWFYLALPVLMLAGCYEVNEDIVINADGTGTYSSKMDMSQLLEMIQMMAGDDSSLQANMDKSIDTSFNMGSLADSSKDITAPQRELMKQGKMHLLMNMPEKQFKIDMDFTFKNYIQLQDLMSGAGNNSMGMSQAFKGIMNQGPEVDSNTLDAPRNPGMDDLKDIFTITAKKGLISKQVDTAKLKALMARPEMAQLQAMTSTGMEMQYTTTIHLPSPARRVESSIAKLSDDKKTVSFHYNMLDIFEHPEKFSFRIEY